MHDDGKNCTRELGCWRTVGAGAGRALGRILAGMGWGNAGAHRGDLVARASWEGSRWGSGCIPSAPDYLSVSPLGTRTGSEHGGRPGRPNWRPSQTVKRGERRGSAGGEHVGGTGIAQHVTVPAATLRGAQPCILPAGAHTGSGIGAPGLGGSRCHFQQHVPGSHRETGSPEPRAAALCNSGPWALCKGKLRHARS